ncbi:MAG: ArgE/DapE family deacylase [Candidatus Heimdallarchaeota archaeon]|nr:ArgE/DapE family deacylase [Candidatus Heimdallarchaeota archaeon]
MNVHETEVYKWIRNNKDELIELTQSLVAIPSISGKEYDGQSFLFKKFEEMGLEPSYANPSIEDLRKHEDFFETTCFTKYGYENRPNLIGALKGSGGGQSLCLSGHIDVVSAEPLNQWTRKPFGGEVEGNLLYGRGAGDMKGGLAAMIMATKAFIETGTKLKGNLHLESTIEEEDGGVGGVLYLRMTQPKYDAAIIPEPLGHAIGIASAGVMYFRVKITGVPAHAATAHYGVNAVLKSVPIINALNDLHKKRQQDIRYPYAEQHETMKGKSTTLNIGIIEAGDWPSTVPAECTIECRIGWPPGETREQVREQVENTIKEVSKLDPWLSEHPPLIEWFGWNARPHEMDINHPFTKLMVEEHMRVTKSEPVYMGGAAGLDARYFVSHDIPAITYGPNAERIHSFDEWVDIESMIKVAEVMVSVIQRHCKLS